MLTHPLIKIQQANICDIERLINIEIESHLHIEDDMLDAELNRLLLREYKKRWLLKMQNGMLTFIISFNHTPAGFISFSLFENIAEIHNIYVISSLRRFTLGKQLMTSALQHISHSKVTNIYAWLVEGRRTIIRFYEKMGFTATAQSRVDHINSMVQLVEWKFIHQTSK